MEEGRQHEPDWPAEHEGRFATTHWSVVLAVGQQDSKLAAQALETLCRTYWYPLYTYLRRRGYSEHDAEDLTQGLFAILIEREALQRVEPGRGKFRSWLLASLNHFLNDEYDRRLALKRGGGKPVIIFDAQEAEHRYQLEPPDCETPDRLFDRRWAITLIDQSMHRLARQFQQDGRAEMFAHLRGFLVDGVEVLPYAGLAERLGMSEAAARKAVQRLRQSFRKAIRQEIAETVATASEIDEELRHLWSVLSS